MLYDLVVKNGTVVDPAQRIHGPMDVAFRLGRVAALEESIPEGQAAQVLDASGLIVTPGLVDIHVHVYPGVSHYGIPADSTCLATGATTVADAGSAGAATFPGFRWYIIQSVQTRVKAFLNISAMGMVSSKVGELEDLRWADVPTAVETAREHADLIVGIKVRLSEQLAGKNDLEALSRAQEAASAIGKPVMVHVGNTHSPLERILERLRPGDIMTHSFHGHRHGILDDAGRVLAAAVEAKARGVIFDVGHGAGSFSFDVGEKALSQGFGPDTISIDLHVYNLKGPVFDLATTLSKYLHLGLSLDEVVRLGTEAPARAIGLGDRLGSLRVGCEGDAALLRMEEGRFTFTDSFKKTATGRRRLVPVAVVKGGRVYKKG